MLPWRRRRQNAHPKIQMLNPLRRCSRTTVKPPLTGRTLLWVNDMCCCVSKHAFIHRLQTANGKCAQIPSGILTVCRKPLPQKLPLRVLTMRLTKPPMLLWMSLQLKKKRKERMSTAKELKMSRRKFEQLMGDPVRRGLQRKTKKEEDAAREKRTSLIGSRCLLLVPPSVL